MPILQAQEFNDISVDSLESLLDGESIGERKVWILKELAYKLTRKNPAQALIYVEEALKISQQIKFTKGIAESKHTLGLIQFYVGDYEIALTNYLAAFEIRESIDDAVGLGRSCNNIGVIYSEMGELNLAEKYYKKGLDYRQMAKDSVGVIYSYVNLGDLYLKQGKIAKAIENYNTGSGIAEALNKPKSKAFSLERLARLYEKQENIEKAFENYDEVLKLRYEVGIEYDIANANINLGRLKLEVGYIDEGIRLITKGEKLAIKLEAKPLLSDVYEAFSKAYARQNNYEKAYEYQMKYNDIQNSLLNTNISKELLGLQAKYQFEKNERQLLEQSNEITQLQRTYAVIALLLFVIFLILLYLRYLKQLSTNEDLRRTKVEIEAKNKQLAAYTKELEQFTYIASHDLKEPLRNISGFARLLERHYEAALDKKGQLYLDFIITGVEQMTDLLKDLLRYSEVKRLKTEDLKWIDLNEVVNQIATGLSDKLHQSDGQLIVDNLPKVYSNYFQMTQLFKNFITNGLKFQESGKNPLIEVKGKELKDYWEFRIKDNGIGIDKPFHDKIFEMFKRLHKKTDYQGTGMGLAICKQIVEQHHGEIMVESEKGSGTTFIFTLPKKIVQKG